MSLIRDFYKPVGQCWVICKRCRIAPTRHWDFSAIVHQQVLLMLLYIPFAKPRLCRSRVQQNMVHKLHYMQCRVTLFWYSHSVECHVCGGENFSLELKSRAGWIWVWWSHISGAEVLLFTASNYSVYLKLLSVPRMSGEDEAIGVIKPNWVWS